MSARILLAVATAGSLVACRNKPHAGADNVDEKTEGGRAAPAAAWAPVPQRECYDAPPLETEGGSEHTGQVRWADDLPQPRKGARILAYAVDGGALVARAVSGDDGTFVLRAPAVHVRLAVCHRGARDYVQAEAHRDLDDVNLAAVTSLNVTMYPEGIVGGRIVRAGGQPVAATRVEVRSHTDSRAAVIADAMTDADGRFAIGGLPWDLVTVEARTDTEAGTFTGQPLWDQPLLGIATLAPATPVEIRIEGERIDSCSPMILRHRAPDALDLAAAPFGDDRIARFPPMVPGRYLVLSPCDLGLAREIEVRAGPRQVFACEIGTDTCKPVTTP